MHKAAADGNASLGRDRLLGGPEHHFLATAVSHLCQLLSRHVILLFRLKKNQTSLPFVDQEISSTPPFNAFTLETVMLSRGTAGRQRRTRIELNNEQGVCHFESYLNLL
jgi:hypothetical protein